MPHNTPSNQAAQGIFAAIRRIVGDILGQRADSLNPSVTFRDLGLDSVGTISLAQRLSIALGREIAPVFIWQHPSIERLARALHGGDHAHGGSPAQAALAVALAEPIAIIGIACRFPGGADTPERLWENLCKGVDSIREVPADRWNADAFYDPEGRPGTIVTRRGGFLDDVDRFDPMFFGISPREAEQMDPQQRLMLELSWEAIEDAGEAPTSLHERPVGVFAGAVFNDYSVLQAQTGTEGLTQHSSTGSVQAIIANRVSYTLGLTGPSLVVNTACSASLVSVHLAAQSLRLGECELAIAGGVQLMLSPDTMVALSSLGALSPDGRCYTFDARANGFTRGEGGGVVILKRLSHALRDEDRIYAVLRGSAVNNDGPSNGLTAPSPEAQIAMARSALEQSGVAPDEVAYVELHGTGTPLGDPIEASALGAVYGVRRERPLRVGSIKTNIGHLEGAAGIAGLIKAALCLHHRTLVPSLNYEKPSPHIPFEALKLEVVTAAAPWEALSGSPRRAGVSSFGFGGTNAHAILEEAPRADAWALPIAAESPGALRAAAGAWVERVGCAHSWEAVTAACAAAGAACTAAGASTGADTGTAAARRIGTARAVVVGTDRSELLDGLIALRDGRELSTRSSAGEAPALPLRPVFVFSGLGPQWRGMSRRMYEAASAFHTTLDACDAAFSVIGSFGLVDALFNDDLDLDDGDAHDIHQPLIIATQIAMASQWRAWGVEPGAVIGHSVGEVAAACVAGALSIPDAMRVVAQFGDRCRKTIEAGGTVMAFVRKPEAELVPLTKSFEGALFITGVNDPGSSVVCGEQGLVEKLLDRWQAEGTFCRALSRVHCHCPLGAPFVADMPASLACLAPRKARVPMASTSRGGFVEGPELDAAYWTENLSRPVRFADGIEALAHAGHRVFVEASPHAVLTRSIEASLRAMGVEGAVIASQRRDEDGLLTALAAAGQLFSLGAPLDWIAALGHGDHFTSGNEEAREQACLPLYLSARSEGALDAYAGRLRAHIESHPAIRLSDLSQSLAARAAHEERLVLMARSIEEARRALSQIERREAAAELVRGRAGRRGKVAFVFPGQGAQWQGMGRELLERPVFARAMRACDEALRPFTGWSVTEVVAGRSELSLQRIDVVQPALFAMGVALAALWQSFGLAPDGVVGHSQGEVAAACVAGALSLEAAARVIARRSALLLGLSGAGAMAVVGEDAATVRRRLMGWEGRLNVAVVNSHRSTVVSGDPEALNAWLSGLSDEGIFVKPVAVDVASHSPAVDPLKDAILAEFAEVRGQSSGIDLYSTVRGSRLSGEALDAGYFWENLRRPVEYAATISGMLADGFATFVEMSAHPLLVTETESLAEGRGEGATAVGSLRRGQGGVDALAESVGQLWARGLALPLENVLGSGARKVPLPAYAYQRQRYWLPSAGVGGAAALGGTSGKYKLSGVAFELPERRWHHVLPLSAQHQPYLSEHTVFGRVVVPGAFFMAVVLSIAATRWPDAPIGVEDLTITRPLVLVGERHLHAIVELQGGGERARVELFTTEGGEWTSHASSAIVARIGEATGAADWSEVQAEHRIARDPAALYDELWDAGVVWGPGWRSLISLAAGGEGSGLASAELPREEAEAGRAPIHPILLDNLWGAALAASIDGDVESHDKTKTNADTSASTRLPFAVDELCLFRDITGAVSSHARARGERGGTDTFDLTLYSGEGEVVATIRGLRFRRAEASAFAAGDKSTPLYEIAWRRLPEEPRAGEAAQPEGRWIIVADARSTGERLRAALPGSELVLIGEGVDGSDADSLAAALERAAAGSPIGGVVRAFSSGGESPTSMAARAQMLTEAGLAFAQGLARAASTQPTAPRLCWITTGAHLACEADRAASWLDPAQTSLWGLARVLRTEDPRQGALLVDTAPGHEPEALLAALRGTRGGDTQLAWRDGALFAARLTHAPAPAERWSMRTDGAALITGGLGHIGSLIARWLVLEKGIRSLLLVGRRGEGSEDVNERLREIRALGADIRIVAADIADEEQALQKIRDALASFPERRPLRAIIHAAAVLDDAIIERQSKARIERVFAPKVRGAWTLHRLAESEDLDLFVALSSVASVVGTAGQGNYAAANAFLDGLMQWRRAQGKPGQSQNWGPWSEGGLAAAMESQHRNALSEDGLVSLDPEEGVVAFEAALSSGKSQVAPLRLDLAKLRRWVGGAAPGAAFYSEILGAPAPAKAPERGPKQLETRGPVGERELVRVVAGEAARALGLPDAADVPLDRPLKELGLDSLMAVKLRNAVASRLNVSLPATLVYDHPTIKALVSHLQALSAPPEPSALPLKAVTTSGDRDDAIAIVGMGCRLPGGVDTPEALWGLLTAGRDATEEVPPERWDATALYDPNPGADGKIITRRGGFLADVDQFDAAFFGVSGREASAMDPQHRLLLEVSFEALERAGMAPDSLAGTNTGVFVGVMSHDYERLLGRRPERLDGHVTTGNAASVASGRISYLLGIVGPSVSIDTACSSSLVAVHMACQSLRAGECDAAIAGGVTLNLTPDLHIEFSRLRGLSPDGRCKSFSAAADGVGWSEGCGVVVLKRLRDARAAGDRVLAVIRGSAVNQDGRSNGLTAPNGASQEAVIRQALARAGVDPSDVDYVEAHGTGTALGDPIEARALGAVFGGKKAPLLIGSIKTNLGHAQAAAGVSGLIKVVMSLRHGELPKSLHFDVPSPHIPWSELPIEVVAEPRAWPARGARRLAGVSSFGISGTNAHVVVEGIDPAEEDPDLGAPEVSGEATLVVLSGPTREGLRAWAGRLRDHVRAEPRSLASTAFSLATTRSHFGERAAFVVPSLEALSGRLEALLGGEEMEPKGPGFSACAGSARPLGPTAFLFTGQGSQYSGMGRRLYDRAEASAFREALDACAEIAGALLDEPLIPLMFEERRGPEGTALDETSRTQPALFAIEYALAMQWIAWGMRPDVLLGHSVGEIAAAAVAGVFSLEDGLRLVAARGRLMAGLKERGAMFAVEVPAKEVERRIAPFAGSLSIAAVNGPTQTVISGREADALTIAGGFEGARVRRLRASHAFHSPLMDPMLEDFRAVAASVTYHSSRIPVVSCLEGAGESIASAEHWVEHVRKPVLFSEGIQALSRQGVETFVEVGPHPQLIPAAASVLTDGKRRIFLSSLREGEPDASAMLAGLARWYVEGGRVDWASVFSRGGRSPARVSLPTYPFQRRRHWIEPDALEVESARPSLLVEPIWRRRRIDALVTPVASSESPRGAWLLMSGGSPSEGGARAVIAEALGARVLRGVEDLREACSGEARWKGIIWVTTPGQPVDWATLLDVSRALAEASGPPLFCVTQGACCTRADDASSDPDQASVWGFWSALVREHPALAGKLIDLPAPEAPAGQGSSVKADAEMAAAILAGDSGEEHLAIRGGGVLVKRLAKPAHAAREARFTARGTYVITGGTGALGRIIGAWLAERGAERIVLLSRRGLEALDAESRFQLAAPIEVAAVDVTSRDAMRAELDRLRSSGPAMRGIVHAAGSLEDATLKNQDLARFNRALKPKIEGARVLDELTGEDDLDVFLLMSSMSSIVGSMGQTGYAAANAYLDELAHARRLRGKPALSVNWGPWDGDGMAEGLHRHFDRIGLRPLSAGAALSALEEALLARRAQVVIADVDWARFRAAHDGARVRPLLDDLAAPKPLAVAEEGGMASKLSAATGDERAILLTRWLRRAVAGVLGVALEDVTTTRGFFAMGMDSMMALELRNLIQAEFGLVVGPTATFNHPDIESLATFLSALSAKGENGRRPAKAEAGADPHTNTNTKNTKIAGDDAIAVIGLGFRLPGGIDDAASLWEMLASGACAVRSIPTDRWDTDDGPSASGIYVRGGAFLGDVSGFDNTFFGIPDLEARRMDPQHRLLLETSFCALENAGIVPSRLRDTRTGVYVGIGSSDYEALAHEAGASAFADAYAGTGTDASFASGRLSYLLGLQGPSLSVNTACSSSLVALHLACQGLRAGECDLALAGGVSLMLSPNLFVYLCQIKALSADGRCKAFSDEADGYGRGEGSGVIVLKRLSDALAAGDQVLAVVRGSAVCHDGRSSGLTVPNGMSQRRVMREALEAAGISARDVDYIEAHGTGTPLGDPIEVEALADVFSAGRTPERPLWIGSIKTNIGHLEAAAGVAGILKVIAALRAEQIPPHLHAARRSRHIPWGQIPVDIPEAPVAWPRGDRPRRAGVSSFGLSGTNAHVVLEEAPAAIEMKSAAGEPPAIYPLYLSARTDAALRAQAGKLRAHLEERTDATLRDLSFSLATTRAGHEERLAVLAGSMEQARSALAAFEAGDAIQSHRRGRADALGKVAFVFSGQGGQRPGMGKALLEMPVFAEALRRCDEALRPFTGFSVAELIRAEQPLDRIDIVQPALFAIAVSLAALWRSFGVSPDAVVGHSQGEVAAACVAGALSLEDAALVIAKRSALLRDVSGRGAMAVVGEEPSIVKRWLEGWEDLSVAVVNSPRSTVVSGSTEAMDAWLSGLPEEVYTSRTNIDFASHSPLMNPVRDPLLQALEGVRGRDAETTMYSTVLASKVAGTELNSHYFWDNLREPVAYAETVRRMLEDGFTTFIEVSAHPLLLTATETVASAGTGTATRTGADTDTATRTGAVRGTPIVTTGSLRRDTDDIDALRASVAALWVRGVDLEWTQVFGGEPARRVPLPTYAFQRRPHWIPKAREHGAAGLGGKETAFALSGVRFDLPRGARHHALRVGPKNQPYLAEHVVYGHVVAPGALFISMALAAAAERWPGHSLRLDDVQFVRPLVVDEDARVMMLVEDLDEEGAARFEIASESPEGPQTHATGTMRRGAGEVGPTITSAPEGSLSPVATGKLVSELEEMGIAWGPGWQRIEGLKRGQGQAVATVAMDGAEDQEAAPIHPIALDNGFGVGFAARGGDHQGAARGVAELPFAVNSIVLHRPPKGELQCVARARPRMSSDTATCDINFIDIDGNSVVMIEGFSSKRAPEGVFAGAQAERVADSTFAIRWRDAGSTRRPFPKGPWLIVSDERAALDEIKAILADHHPLSITHAVLGVELARDDEGEGGEATQAWLRSIAEAGPWSSVICLFSSGGEPTASPPERARVLTTRGLRVLQALARLSEAQGSPPRVWWVTRGAHVSDPAQAALWGLGRVWLSEHPEMAGTLVDLTPGEPVASLAVALTTAADESQLSVRKGSVRVARLVRRSTAESERAGREAGSVPESGAVIITGGLGFLGALTARWLVEQGARDLVLLGRSDLREEAEGSSQSLLQELEASGARVRYARVDVADREALSALLDEIRALRPIRGVVHAAGVLSDGLLTRLSEQDVTRVLAPKIAGSFHLHELTLADDLALFVLYSSAASLVGNAGQGVYAAANAYLDALAHVRAAAGLCALSINWGPWSGGGLAEALPSAHRERHENHGYRFIDPDAGMLYLRAALADHEPQIVALPHIKSRLRAALASARGRSLLTEIAGGWEREADRPRRLALADLEGEALQNALRDLVIEEVARSIGRPDSAGIPRDRPLRELGMDSLMAIQLKNALAARLGAPLPATLAYDHPSVNAICAFILREVIAPAPRPRDKMRAPAPREAARAHAHKDADGPIAIVGMGCRFPGGARDPESLWSLLVRGADTTEEITRWDIDALYDPDPNKKGSMTTRYGSFVEDIDRFDAAFFGIGGREAERMDPQHRILLEATCDALEHAGLPLESLSGSNTGVFIGVMSRDYYELAGSNLEELDGYLATGNAASVASGRISYHLGLTGPSMAVDTACSSSLVAVHLACQSLRSGECETAIVGGVTLVLSPKLHVEFSRLRGVAEDGRCKSFAAAADGVGWSEGCGVVVLKPLVRALEDGDRILAVIRGSAVNQDGRSNGLTAPNGPSQEAVIRRALEQGGVDPLDVEFVEAHGTGTTLGDPIEVQALAEAYGRRRGAQTPKPLRIGSIKSNIGHAQAAAGIAGLMKAVLAVDRGKLPKSLHFDAPNPHIPWDQLAVEVVDELCDWPNDVRPRIAGVSSFGISGTNAHVIVEQPPSAGEHAQSSPADAQPRPSIVTVSARDPESLQQAAGRLGAWLREHPGASLDDLATTTTRRRNHHTFRAAALGRSTQEIASQLLAYAEGATRPDVAAGRASVRGKTVFVFPGQGSQWLGMGRALLAEEPAFAASMRACDAALRPHTGWSLLEAITGDVQAGASPDAASVVQPMLFAIHASLAAVWRSWGVEPDAVIGHSQGEVAAAFVAGALTLDDAARVVALRSRLLSRITGLGAMALVGLSASALEVWLAGREDRIEIAAENSQDATVVSGDADAIASLLMELERAGVFGRRVNVEYASHGRHVELVREGILEALAPITPKRAAVPILSTVTGALLEGPELGAAYWFENLRRPVRFAPALRSLVEGGHRFFIEVSAHPLLTLSIAESVERDDVGGAVVGSLRRDEGDRGPMLRSLSELYVRGYPVQWERLHPGSSPPLDLPTYPFRRDRYWLPLAPVAAEARRLGHPLIVRSSASSASSASLSASSPGARVWEQTLSLRDLPYLADHVVAGATLVPAAAFMEMAAAGARELWGPVAVTLEDVRFARALVLREQEDARVRMTLTEFRAGEVTLAIESAEGAAWTEHVRGRIRSGSGMAGARTLPPVGPEAERLGAGEAYEALSAMGLSYGEAFRGIEHLAREGAVVEASVRLPAKAGRAAGYVAHPALLDACLQSLALAAAASTEGPAVPVAVRSMAILGSLGDRARCRGQMHKDGAALRGDLVITGEDGALLAFIEGLTAEPLERNGHETADPLDEVLLDVRWIEKPAPPSAAPGRWLLLADRGGVARALCERIIASGGEVDLVEPGSVDAHRPAAVREALSARMARGVSAVVCLWGLDTPSLSDPGAFAALNTQNSLNFSATIKNTNSTKTAHERLTGQVLEQGAGWAGALHVAQALAGSPDRAPLVFVTHNAHPHALRGPARPEQALLWGLAGAVRAEHPRLLVRTVDLSDPSDASELTSLLEELSAITADDREELVALRGPTRYVARLGRPGAFQQPLPKTHAAEEEAGDRAYRLQTDSSIEGLALHPFERRPPGPSEVEIEVEAAGLNFLDVLSALGAISRELGTAESLGTECVGRAVRVGHDVRGIAPGDRVIAITGGSFASHVIASSTLTFPCPPGLSPDVAATLPMAHVTAYYSLHHVARLAEGERILIHSAAGGVGQAAIQWARHVGATIFATAGSEEKRAFLRRQGITHVSDSRSGQFVEDILRQTNGEGVDVVLNALGGRRIQESLELLRDHGRFIELGKRDYIDDAPLRTRPFLRSLTFSLVDLRSLILKRPALVRQALREVLDHVERGVLTPIQHRTFRIDEARSAFLEMAQGTHIGKLVAAPSKQALIRAPRSIDGPLVRAEGSYLVTGGLGGLGLSIAEWMASKEAGHVVLLGRSGALDEQQAAAIARIEALGCRVSVKACDVCDRRGLAAIVDELSASDRPLRGVIHAAGVLSDAPLMQQTMNSFREVLAPKILGAWNLHELTLDLDNLGKKLDFFVLYSSAVTLVGLAGQANYAAANAFLVQLAELRRKLGLPSLCVDWGSFGDVGLAADKDVRGERLASRGLPSMKPEDAHAILDWALRAGITRIGAQPIRARQWLEFYPELATRPYLSELLASAPSAVRGGDLDLLAKFRAMSPDEGRTAMVDHVRKRAADVLRRDPLWIDTRAPLSSFGLDSLMGLELRNRLETDLGIRLSATMAWTYPTVDALAGELHRRVFGLSNTEPAAQSPAQPEPPEPPEGHVSALGEDELLDYLDQMLEAEAKGPRP